jgi:FixJ family two-component response regulator
MSPETWRRRAGRYRVLSARLGEDQASGRIAALAAAAEARLAESKRLSADAAVLTAMTRVLLAEIDTVLAHGNSRPNEARSLLRRGHLRAEDVREAARLCVAESKAALGAEMKQAVASRAFALAELAEQMGRPAAQPPASSSAASFPPQSRQLEGAVPAPASWADTATIFVVEDDSAVRQSLRELLRSNGHRVAAFPSGESFLDAYQAGFEGCLVIDASGPGMKGIEVLSELRTRGSSLPVLMTSAECNVATAVQAMKAGARDFIEKPFDERQILSVIGQALAERAAAANTERRILAVQRLASLTKRQREILDLIVAGHPNKKVAARLGIDRRTVEAHRALLMKKMEASSFAELVRLTLAAASPPARPL